MYITIAKDNHINDGSEEECAFLVYYDQQSILSQHGTCHAYIVEKYGRSFDKGKGVMPAAVVFEGKKKELLFVPGILSKVGTKYRFSPFGDDSSLHVTLSSKSLEQKNNSLQQLISEMNSSTNFIINQKKADLHINSFTNLEKRMLSGRSFSRIWIAELIVAQFPLTFTICNLLQNKTIDDGFEIRETVSACDANKEQVYFVWYPCPLPVDAAFWLREKACGQSMPVEEYMATRPLIQGYYQAFFQTHVDSSREQQGNGFCYFLDSDDSRLPVYLAQRKDGTYVDPTFSVLVHFYGGSRSGTLLGTKILQEPGQTEFRQLAVFPDTDLVRSGLTGFVKNFPPTQPWKEELVKAQRTNTVITSWSHTNWNAVNHFYSGKISGSPSLASPQNATSSGSSSTNSLPRPSEKNDDETEKGENESSSVQVSKRVLRSSPSPSKICTTQSDPNAIAKQPPLKKRKKSSKKLTTPKKN